MLITSGTLTVESLAGQVAIVTGAGRGIGFEAARSLIGLGARVVLAEVDQGTGEKAQRRLAQEFGSGHALLVPTDVGDEGSVNRLKSTVLSKFGADMRDFTLDRAFRLVTIPFRPFQHLTTVEDQISCLRTIHRHLEKGGRLILDIFNPSLDALTQDNVGEEIGEGPEFVTSDGRKVIPRHRIVSRDLHNQINHVELIYYVTHPDGTEERLVHAFPMRHLFRFEAEHLLVRCGFEVEALYADSDKSPYGSKYPGELIFVAKKG